MMDCVFPQILRDRFRELRNSDGVNPACSMSFVTLFLAQREAIDRHVLGEVLRALLTQILEPDSEFVLDLIINLLGNQHTARFGQFE